MTADRIRRRTSCADADCDQQRARRAAAARAPTRRRRAAAARRCSRTGRRRRPARPGRQLPKIIAARPMKPRPPVCPRGRCSAATIARKAPPSPASAAGDDDGDVLVPVDVDAERLGRDRVLAAGPQPQAERGAPQHEKVSHEQQDRDTVSSETFGREPRRACRRGRRRRTSPCSSRSPAAGPRQPGIVTVGDVRRAAATGSRRRPACPRRRPRRGTA